MEILDIMKFIIRHQTSLLEEEVYEFEITKSIEYRCFWLSKRKSENEPWGYDWSEVYENDMIRLEVRPTAFGVKRIELLVECYVGEIKMCDGKFVFCSFKDGRSHPHGLKN